MEKIQISLKAARVNAGLSQLEAAKAMKISKNTLVSWEKNETVPSVSQARKLAEIYNYPLDNIYFLKNKSN